MLTSPAITELSVESGTCKLFNEWLAKWFDGAPHTLAGVCMPFPKANRAFGQGAPAQPLHDFDQGVDAEIRLVTHPRAEVAASNDTALYQGKLITDHVVLHFWVSAKKPGQGQSEYLARTIGERLKALLTNPDARYELAERGICHLQPQGPPQLMPSADYHKRLVSCNAQLTYFVQYSDAPPPVVTVAPGEFLGATQLVNFHRESPLLAGTYLLGYYRWSLRVRVTSAQVTAWAPQGIDVVLGLEVDGQATGQTVVIPQGKPNAEVTARADFQDLFLAPEQAVRWKVLAAPEGELTAWQANLAIEVQGA